MPTNSINHTRRLLTPRTPAALLLAACVASSLSLSLAGCASRPSSGETSAGLQSLANDDSALTLPPDAAERLSTLQHPPTSNEDIARLAKEQIALQEAYAKIPPKPSRASRTRPNPEPTPNPTSSSTSNSTSNSNPDPEPTSQASTASSATLSDADFSLANAASDPTSTPSPTSLPQTNPPPTPPTPPTPSPSPASSITQSGDAAWDQEVTQAASTPAHQPPKNSPPPPPSRITTLTGTPTNANTTAGALRANSQRTGQSSSDDQLVELATKMASLLREGQSPATGGKPAIADAAALAPIESLRPGALADLDNSRSMLSRRLSPQDRKALIDARERIAASPSSAADAFAKSMAAIAPSQPLKVTRALLCTRVTGFGKYSAITRDTFPAGRALPAIVYVEVENFTSRPAKDADPIIQGVATSEQTSVELAQSLSLFQDATSLLVWHRPPQVAIETSRGVRRDFYLTQMIELPRTLGVGKYNLKVTIKDRTTGSEAEAIIPITLTAQ